MRRIGLQRFSRPSVVYPGQHFFCTSATKPRKEGRSSAAVSKSQDYTKEGNTERYAIDITPPRGTRDFYPEDYKLRSWIFSKWRDAAMKYGFEEYDAPVVENEELYIRKGGEELSQQLYNFTDKSQRKLCLRPEMTPSLARMILAKGSRLSMPIKWFSIPQCWRYERMSKGRRREHYQWNMDIWGVGSIEAEGELLASLITSIGSMGLTSDDVVVKINSRKLIISILSACGIPANIHISVCVVIDKLDKLAPEEVEKELHALGVTALSIEKLMEFLKFSTLEQFSDVLSSDGLTELHRLFTILRCYGFSSWIQFDPKIVRGLSYYTGTVFECFDRQGEFRAICGGGRYDTLLSTYSPSSTPIPAVGFGFGDAVIVELLKSKNLLPNFALESHVDVVVAVTDDDESLYSRAIKVASGLRAASYRVDLLLQPKRMKSILQTADRMHVMNVIIFSPHEAQGGNTNALLRSMGDGHQEIVSDDELVKTLDWWRMKALN